MPTFRFEWTEEYFYRTYIVATDEQDAIDKWSAGKYQDYGRLEPYDIYLQESVVIDKIEDEE